MGYILTFFLGGFFGIILMGLCVASSYDHRDDKKNNDTDDENECYCDKE